MPSQSELLNRRRAQWTRRTKVTIILLVVTLLSLGASRLVEQNMAANSVFAVRVQVDETANDLFGESSGNLRPIGSPQRFVIRDEKAFLKGVDPNGARYLDDAYLKKNNIYPLQVKTVQFFASMFRIGALVVGGLLAAFLIYANRRRRELLHEHPSGESADAMSPDPG